MTSERLDRGNMDDRKNAPKPLPGQNAESLFNAKPTNRFIDAIQQRDPQDPRQRVHEPTVEPQRTLGDACGPSTGEHE